MPYLREISYIDGSRVHVWDVTETLDELVNLCHRRNIDTTVMSQYKARKRRVEVLVEHLLLCIIFGKPVKLEHTSDGKPFVKAAKCFISITHTHGLVCIAENRKFPIGVDVERKGTRVLNVRDRFLSKREQDFIADNDAEATLIAWTAKEALFKVVDDPHATMLEDLQLDPFKPSIVGALKFTASYKDKHFTLKSLSWHAHILTLAIETCNDSKQNPTTKHKPNIIEL